MSINFVSIETKIYPASPANEKISFLGSHRSHRNIGFTAGDSN